MLNRILFASVAAILLLGFIGFRNSKHRSKISEQVKQLQSQKIIQLEKDRQLLAIDSMLKGQEEERSRIAKDLHDGLGGLLSGTKMALMNIRQQAKAHRLLPQAVMSRRTR